MLQQGGLGNDVVFGGLDFVASCPSFYLPFGHLFYQQPFNCPGAMVAKARIVACLDHLLRSGLLFLGHLSPFVTALLSRSAGICWRQSFCSWGACRSCSHTCQPGVHV